MTFCFVVRYCGSWILAFSRGTCLVSTWMWDRLETTGVIFTFLVGYRVSIFITVCAIFTSCVRKVHASVSVCLPDAFSGAWGGGHVMFGTIGSAFEGHGSPPSVDMWIVHACRMNIELYTLYEYCLDFQKRYCWRSSIQRLSVGAHSEFQYFTGMTISIQSRCNLTFLFPAQFSIPSSRRIGARLSMVAYSRNV